MFARCVGLLLWRVSDGKSIVEKLVLLNFNILNE